MSLHRASSLKGSVRKTTAPAFIAWTVIGTSPCPVMKMIGMPRRSAAMRFWSSRPLSPGSRISSTRQLGTRAGELPRKSCAEANVSGLHPALRINSSRDSRTEMSSSTTNTMGWGSAMCGTSGRSKRGTERVEQSGLAEWLEQPLHGAPLEQTGTNTRIRVRSDEDDGNRLPATGQFLLEIGSAHARHGDVEDKASSLVETIGRQERFRRCKRARREAELHQQIRERLPDRLIVVHDRNEGRAGCHVLATACPASLLVDARMAPMLGASAIPLDPPGIENE